MNISNNLSKYQKKEIRELLQYNLQMRHMKRYKDHVTKTIKFIYKRLIEIKQMSQIKYVQITEQVLIYSHDFNVYK